MTPTFKYVFVPADDTAKIVEHVGDCAGGLQSDELRLKAEEFFGKGEASSVEIVSLMLPCAANGFVGVSMYCDSTSKIKNLDPNRRATSIANICGYATQVLGDAFFGRYHDDESMEWERLDFGVEDLNSDAEWVKAAAKMNKGRSMGSATTSGLLQNMLRPNNTSVVDGFQEDAKQAAALGVDQVTDAFLAWSQTTDEVEVKISITGKLKAADLAVKIKSKSLQVTPKTPLEPWTSHAEELHAAMSAGAELWGTVDPDCSGWTLDKGRGDEVTLVLTLAKNRNVNWPSLTA